jgi:hypothetical protein
MIDPTATTTTAGHHHQGFVEKVLVPHGLLLDRIEKMAQGKLFLPPCKIDLVLPSREDGVKVW